MESDKLGNIILGVCWAFYAACFALIVYALCYEAWCALEASNKLTIKNAAWFQAIGTVVAVISSAGIAILISTNQQRHQQREADDLRRMEKIDVLLNLYALSDTAKKHVSMAHLLFNEGEQEIIDRYWSNISPGKHFEYVIHALEQVPLYSVPGDKMVKHLLFLRDSAQKALIATDRTRFRAYSTDKTVNQQRVDQLEMILGIIEDVSAHIRDQTEKEAALIHHQERVSNLFPSEN